MEVNSYPLYILRTMIAINEHYYVCLKFAGVNKIAFIALFTKITATRQITQGRHMHRK